MERCKNPWKNNCKNGNIKLYIQFEGEKLPICKRCWSSIADSEISWGDQPMESFSLNSAKSFLGKNVNLHLKDGAVIVNVQLTGIRKSDFGKARLIEYVPYGNRKSACVPLRHIEWAEMLNLSLLQAAG